MWKGLLVGICIIIPIILYIMIYLNSILNNQYDENFMAIYRFFCFFLIINIIICAFSIIYYYYKIDIPGNKGPGGDKGDIGNQGQNKSCEICEKRDNKFSKKTKKLEIEEIMFNDSVEDFSKKNNNKETEIKYYNSVKGVSNRWNIHTNINNDAKIIGDNSNLCKGNITTLPPLFEYNPIFKIKSPASVIKESCKDSGKLQSNTYINGAIIRVDEKTKDLYSIQYRSNNEKKNGRKYINSTTNLGNRWGGQNVIRKWTDKKEQKEDIIHGNDRGKYYDFECPKNSGIFRIDTLHKPKSNVSGNITGIKFFCKDVNTGKDVKIDTHYGKNKKNIYFGSNPSNKNGKYIYRRVVCNPIKKDNKIKPSFISGVGAIHGDRINALKFYNCSFKK